MSLSDKKCIMPEEYQEAYNFISHEMFRLKDVREAVRELIEEFELCAKDTYQGDENSLCRVVHVSDMPSFIDKLKEIFGEKLI